MRKLFWTLLPLIVAPVLHAQDSGNGRSLEVTAGTNHSSFTDEGAECLHWCLFFGAEVVLCDRGPLRFSTGAHYRGGGSEYNSGEDFGEGESYSMQTRVTLGYLNIPAEARYEFGGGKIKPFVRGGGTLGFLLSAKSKTTVRFNDQENETEREIKEEKKSLNFALSFGGGVSFPLGKFRGAASMRYLVGLTNIVKNGEAPGARTNDLTYALSLGIPIF